MLYSQGLAAATRNVDLRFWPTCGTIACPNGACATAPDGAEQCIDEITDAMFPAAY